MSLLPPLGDSAGDEVERLGEDVGAHDVGAAVEARAPLAPLSILHIQAKL